MEMNKLHLMDCMEGMKEFPDNYFDLSIIDPPYGIGAAKMKMGKGSGNDTGKHKKKEWDNKIPPAEYFIELFRISKNQIIWGGNYFINYLKNTRCFLLWDKLDYNSDFASHELAWTSFDKNTKCYRRARSAGGDSKNKIHPTQKPIQLYKWLLKNYATKDMKIIDTHVGSGSSIIAFIDFGCEWIGFEIDADYHKAASKRIAIHKQQLRMFQ